MQPQHFVCYFEKNIFTNYICRDTIFCVKKSLRWHGDAGKMIIKLLCGLAGRHEPLFC